MKKFENKVVLVTGSSRGIGKMLTDYFLSEGSIVIGVSMNSIDKVDSNFYQKKIDISNPHDINRLFIFIKNNFNKLDILINNAGIAYSSQSILLSYEKAKKMIDTNILGTFLVSKESSKLMMKNKYGRVVNIGSISASLEPIGANIYTATKSAIHSLSNSLAFEFSKYNITFNTISLSPYPSDMLNTISAKDIDWYLSRQKINRLANSEDIINVISFFCSEKSSFITAQNINLGGIS